MKNILSGLFCLIAFTFSQDLEDQKVGVKKGIGFEFQEINSFLSESSSSSHSMYFPMIAGKWMIEPQLFFFNQTFETNYDSNANMAYYQGEAKESSLGFILGVSSRNEHSTKVASYFGVEAGVANVREKDAGDEDISKADIILFGISLGVEYYISEHLSFGGEYAFRFGSYEEENKDPFGEEYIRTGKLSGSVPVLMFRFYF